MLTMSSRARKNYHPFIRCPFTKLIRKEIQRKEGNKFVWQGDYIEDCLKKWLDANPKINLKSLPLIVN